MITMRTANQCGKADYGWLQARYTFSFGHYFDPKFLNYRTLRVLNQEVLAPKAEFQPKSYPHVDVLNIILQGEAQYRDSEGNSFHARQGDCLLFSARQGIRYSEHNTSDTRPLTRLQLWLNACPQQEARPLQHITLPNKPLTLLASPTSENHSMHLRQQVWISYLVLKPHDSQILALRGNHAYLQSISGKAITHGNQSGGVKINCGDGVFIQEEQEVLLQAETPFRGLLIDLAD
ncbi:pirin family protein [Xenorhabdus griffiniae]|uniref:Pirin family protein n=1 Tax=Xenorhabdus griffiniae TaxID=351672 RepID=A0ABY9XJ88_9GAMM|nr:pirin family protein [Xenorhabdus griffiniae]MBD1226785.1 pirin family protein [Xenorhabdus griffiniae]MBE8586790.1 pirin family protein [Xenorhabdus griffiniae]WMV72957.1 pirin family protein [Xenorhabdus griffiniae]WNH02636.1 pirin family protein [Xenorhabdus griffiniae]